MKSFNFTIGFAALATILAFLPADANAQNFTQRGTRQGAVAGAIIGGLIGDRNNEALAGAAIGGLVGGATGRAIGRSKDIRYNYGGKGGFGYQNSYVAPRGPYAQPRGYGNVNLSIGNNRPYYPTNRSYRGSYGGRGGCSGRRGY